MQISHVMTPLIRLVRSRCICRQSCRRCWWLWLCCLFLCSCWGSQYKNTSHTRGRQLRFLWATLLNSSTSVFVCVCVTMLSSSVGRQTSFASRKRLYKCSPGRGGCKRRRRRGGKREIGETRCVCVCVCVQSVYNQLALHSIKVHIWSVLAVGIKSMTLPLLACCTISGLLNTFLDL